MRHDDVEALAAARRWCEDGTAREILARSGLTQAAVARLARTNQPTVSRWLAGERLPRSTPAGVRFARLLRRLARPVAVPDGAA